MLDRLHAMAVKVVLGGLQRMLGCAHMFQCFIDVRMPFRSRHRCGSRNCSCYRDGSRGG